MNADAFVAFLIPNAQNWIASQRDTHRPHSIPLPSNGTDGKAKGDISIYGQESNFTTWRLAKINLAIRGIDGQIGHGDTFHNDRHPDLRADFILANPPFNISDWGGERLRDNNRWQYGVPPAGNANFAWVQHMVHHLAPIGCRQPHALHLNSQSLVELVRQ